MDVNIYCDESTHLENDQMPYLVLGAVSCPQAKTPEVLSRLHEIRKKHGYPMNSKRSGPRYRHRKLTIIWISLTTFSMMMTCPSARSSLTKRA